MNPLFLQLFEYVPSSAITILFIYLSYMILAQVLGDTGSYLLGEPLGKYHQIETIKTLNIYTPDDGSCMSLSLLLLTNFTLGFHL